MRKGGNRMNLEAAILDLEHIRDVERICWEDYHEKAKSDPFLRDTRDIFEMHVRSLDYAINILKRTERSTDHGKDHEHPHHLY